MYRGLTCKAITYKHISEDDEGGDMFPVVLSGVELTGESM